MFDQSDLQRLHEDIMKMLNTASVNDRPRLINSISSRTIDYMLENKIPGYAFLYVLIAKLRGLKS